MEQQKSKYTYDDTMFVSDDQTYFGRMYCNRICRNANFRVLPFMIAKGMKIEGNLKAVIKASKSIDDLFAYVLAVEKYTKNLPEMADPILVEELKKAKRKNFMDEYNAICANNGTDPNFDQVDDLKKYDIFFDIDIVKDGLGNETKATLSYNKQSLENSIRPKMNGAQREIFEKKCKICDALNDLFSFVDMSDERSRTRRTPTPSRDWSEQFVISYNNGRPQISPSKNFLDADQLIIKFM